MIMASASFTTPKISPRLLLPLLFCGLPLSLLLFLYHTTIANHMIYATSPADERGAKLFHTWSDQELFDRAIVAAHKRFPAHQHDHHPSYLLQIHNLVFNSPPSAAAAAPHESRTCHRKSIYWSSQLPKIAFLFLTTGALPFAPLWNQFFRGHERFYNIYVHLDPFTVGVFNRSSGVFWGRLVPPGRTGRGTPALIAAERRLLANALLDDPLNEYFAVISDHCIPLHGFETVYAQVTNSDKSFIEILDDAPTLYSRYIARGENIMLPEVPFSKFRVGSQFFILNWKHAVMVVSDKKYWSKFGLPCLQADTCYAEEHYFPTLIEMEDPQCSTRYTLTFVDWSENAGGHPKMFQRDEISREFIESLQQKEEGRYMFARKFQEDCLDALLQLESVILEH